MGVLINVEIGMAPSATMWRLLSPWQNLHNDAIVSIWPCMPGFHRCSLGLHAPTYTLVNQSAAPGAVEYRQSHSTQFRLTTLPLAIIITIFLASPQFSINHLLSSCFYSPRLVSSAVQHNLISFLQSIL